MITPAEATTKRLLTPVNRTSPIFSAKLRHGTYRATVASIQPCGASVGTKSSLSFAILKGVRSITR